MRTSPIISDEQAQRWLKGLDGTARHHLVQVQGYQVKWREFGQGEPLVLIHGGHGSWMHWVRNVEALSGRFRLLIPDLPGYGDSSAPTFDDLPSMVKLTIASLDEVIGPEAPVNVAGFSFGGLVTANVAVHRKAVKRIALLGPGGHGSTRRPRGDLVNWKRALDEQSLMDAMVRNLWVHMLHADEAIDPLAIRIHRDSCVNTRFRSRPLSAIASLPQTMDEYSGQALIIWGEHDVTTAPEEMMARLVSDRHDRRGQIVPGVGHWVQYEAAETVNRCLLDWFTQV